MESQIWCKLSLGFSGQNFVSRSSVTKDVLTVNDWAAKIDERRIFSGTSHPKKEILTEGWWILGTGTITETRWTTQTNKPWQERESKLRTKKGQPFTVTRIFAIVLTNIHQKRLIILTSSLTLYWGQKPVLIRASAKIAKFLTTITSFPVTTKNFTDKQLKELLSRDCLNEHGPKVVQNAMS